VNQGPVNWIDGLITFVGRQDNLALREAALFAFAANLLMVIAALIAIVVLIPRNRPAQSKTPEQTPAASAGSRARS